MKTPTRARRSVGVIGTSLAAVFGTAALAVPAHTLASTELAAASRSATTSYHFENIPVRSALQLLADEGDFNLVVSDAVTGNITLHLEDVTWEQVLAIVLRMKGLSQVVDGDSRSISAAPR